VPVALVTGANRGIGLEVARQLAAAGYDVLAGARDPDTVPGGLRAVQLDVTDQATIAALDDPLAVEVRGDGGADLPLVEARFEDLAGAGEPLVARALDRCRSHGRGPYAARRKSRGGAARAGANLGDHAGVRWGGAMAEERLQIRMRVIPKPAAGTRTVLVQAGPDDGADCRPMFTGPSDVDQLCGTCGRILVQGVPLGQLRSTVLRCRRCGSCNDLVVGSADVVVDLVAAERSEVVTERR
jgi:hypothetical protein